MSPAWRLRIEVVIVLGLTLGASAVYSIVSLAAKLSEERALGDQSVALNPSRIPAEHAGTEAVDAALGRLAANVPAGLEGLAVLVQSAAKI